MSRLALASGLAAWAAAWLAGTAQAQAEAPAADAEAYCDYLHAAASSENKLAYAPDVSLRAEGRGKASTHRAGDGTDEVRDPLRRYAAEIELGLHDYYRASLRSRHAASECERYKAQRAAVAAVDGAQSAGRAAALRARLAVYRAAIGDFEREQTAVNARLQAGTAAIPELDSISEALATLRTEILDRERELAALGPAGAGPLPSPAPLLAALSEAETKTAALEHAQADAKAWEVSLFAGVERSQYEPQTVERNIDQTTQRINYGALVVQRPVFGVEVKLDLGGAARIGDAAALAAAKARWQTAAPQAPAVKAAAGQAAAQAALPALQQKLAVLRERAAQLDGFAKAAALPGSMRGSEFAQKMHFKAYLARADVAALEAEIAALGGETAAKAAPAASQPAPGAGKLVLPSQTANATYRFAAPVSTSPSGEAAAVELTFKGANAAKRALGSGEVREQLGLMLRQTNECNLVYVMWRLGPHPEIVVQEKVNPGAADHAACGNRGYTRIEPTHAETPPALDPGAHHTLAARIAGDALVVTVDGREVWRGPAPKTVRQGPNIGFRSDNVVVDYRLMEL